MTAFFQLAYSEEDEEAATAARQQRRQQSRIRKKPRERMPWEFATPEEEAKAEVRRALEEELIVYDPKTDASCFTRVWFLDRTIFDLDEESTCPFYNSLYLKRKL
jgi:hypothetical protein